MNRTQANMLSILKNSTHWITSVELSGQMNRSVRSIKMYVKSINETYPNLILSSKDGYKLNTDVYANLSTSLRLVDVPLNSQERVKYILKAILFSQSAVLLDINSFEEELDVSSSTLQNDLRTIKSMLMEYNLHLVTHNQNLNIEGEERDIRRFMTCILSNETQENFCDLGTMKTVFPEYDVEKILHQIKFLAQTHQVSLAPSSHFPLMLNLLIILNRLKNNCYTQNPRSVKIGDFTAVSAFVRSLAKQLAQDYNINFSDSEIDELIILFASYQNYSLQYDLVRNKYVIDSIPAIVQDILYNASAMYQIDLDDGGYLKILFVHIQNLYNRAKQGQHIKNPLTNSIKKKCPFIY